MAKSQGNALRRPAVGLIGFDDAEVFAEDGGAKLSTFFSSALRLPVRRSGQTWVQTVHSWTQYPLVKSM